MLLKMPMPHITDCTSGGSCSSCGGCCSSLIPVTEKELTTLRDIVKRRGLRPAMPSGPDFVTLECPFLGRATVLSKGRACLVYDQRPSICRAFRCDRSQEAVMAEWLRLLGGETPPAEPTNLWSLFGLTGIRTGGVDIPWDGGPSASAWDEHGQGYSFKTGRHLSLVDKSGRRIEGMVLMVQPDALYIADRTSRKTVRVKYRQVDEVLSPSALSDEPSPSETDTRETPSPACP